MADRASNEIDASAAKELLMADYAYLRDSFWKNEEAGEKVAKEKRPGPPFAAHLWGRV